ncbi:30S ribosomal protein S1 [Carboxydochorda subterranea]|uniref:30S ribosomal protein S1 n=1 Tax=Carboxydichorda subterranea TaxID=3109565 RepID=A0ABZ1C192_9FIRM|nr:30S ribosomal protein S1 [Limnochorda sp. L945t]WRP18556.1 30S ribosomal protein S1 [Limnochorda sp. L945t]
MSVDEQQEKLSSSSSEPATEDAPVLQDGAAAAPEEVTARREQAASVDLAGAMSSNELDASLANGLSPGQVVHGRVVQVGPDEVLVDVGYKSDGRIPIHELGLRSGQTPADVLKPGDEIDVWVLKVDENEGGVLLSKRRADQELTWRRLEEAKEQGRILEARVTERVKGGLLVDVGVRGFVPASHVGRGYVEDLDKYVGRTLRLKVLEINRSRRNVVLSCKEVLEQEYQEAKARLFSSLKEGQVVEGTVRRLTDFGAFIDLGGGVEGLLHVSEMAWSRVRHPSDVLSVGQTLKVMVLNVDRERERISLGLKQVLPNPWDTVAERFHVGQIVEGEVTRLVDFGAFVRLDTGIEGLVHISQLSDRHVTKPQEVVSPGQHVRVKILSVDQAARRIGLSLRDAAPKPEPEKASATTATAEAPTVTIGELYGNLGQVLNGPSSQSSAKAASRHEGREDEA